MFKWNLIVFMLCHSLSMPINAVEVYVYHDENGHTIYSDRPPIAGDFDSRPQVEIDTLSWTPTPRIVTTKPKQPKRKISASDRKPKEREACQKLDSRIKMLEGKLESRIQSDEFDKSKGLLAKTRWNYRKRCK